jgi:hypothetical protein
MLCIKKFSIFFALATQLAFVLQGEGACNSPISGGTITATIDGAKTELTIVSARGTTAVYNVSAAGFGLKHDYRTYLVRGCPQSFTPTMYAPEFSFLDKTLSYTVDLSKVPCACNAALYLVAAPGYDANQHPFPSQSEDYYCDANQVGGDYCPEMDIMEANNMAMQITPHKCDSPQGLHYNNCDRGGCGLNTHRLNATAFGPGRDFAINTQAPFRVSTSFSTDTIKTVLAQGSQSFVVTHNSNTCGSSYLPSLSATLKQGMVITFSVWGDTGSTMSWMDVPPCNINTSCDKNSMAMFTDIVLQ